MTRREKITRTIIGFLQSIASSSGYLTNIGSYVSLWGTQIIPHNDTYEVNLRDEGQNYRIGSIRVINYKIELSYSGSNAYTNICNMISDVEKALFNNQDQLSSAINDVGIRIYPGEENIEITREKDKERAYAQFAFTVEHLYQEKWNPDFNNY